MVCKMESLCLKKIYNYLVLHVYLRISYYNLSLTDVRPASSRPFTGRQGPNLRFLDDHHTIR